MTLGIPQPLQAEHDELPAELVRATRAGGRTAAAARTVAGLLHPHFLKEEEYALPSLGLLARAARGEAVPDAAREAAIAMAERLRAEPPAMPEDHGRIVAALDGLTAAASAEGHPEYARFAEKPALHARTGEAVLCPATLLLGMHLKVTAGRSSGDA